MKKKILAAAMATCMTVALAGCGGGAASTSSEAASTATTETSSEASSTAASGDQIVLTWNEVNGEDYGGTVGAHTFADKIEELSGGQIVVELYLNGTLGNEAESMQGIQMGTLDIFRGNASSLSNYGATEISLTGAPFLFKDMEQFQQMATSDMGQELLDSVDEADCGYVALGWLTESPRQMFITENTYKTLGNPTEFTLDMMKGLKIRVPETDLMVNTIGALGASATPIAYAELYTSLQSGVVDGAENDIVNYLANSYNEVAPYFITDAHTFGCGVILMNKDRWNSFTDEQKGWIAEAADAASAACYEYNVQKVEECYAQFEEKGVTVLEVPDLTDWSAACESVYASYDEESQAIIERLKNADY